MKFVGAPPTSVVPERIYGKLLTWSMSAQEIGLLSASCNDNQAFLIEYTPYDQLMTVKRILEACFAAKTNANKKSHLSIEVSRIVRHFLLVRNPMFLNPFLLVSISVQPLEAWNFHILEFNCTPPMGRSNFYEWVRIYKCLHSETILSTIIEICQDYMGKALTKVGNIMAFEQFEKN